MTAIQTFSGKFSENHLVGSLKQEMLEEHFFFC